MFPLTRLSLGSSATRAGATAASAHVSAANAANYVQSPGVGSAVVMPFRGAVGLGHSSTLSNIHPTMTILPRRFCDERSYEGDIETTPASPSTQRHGPNHSRRRASCDIVGRTQRHHARRRTLGQVNGGSPAPGSGTPWVIATPHLAKRRSVSHDDTWRTPSLRAQAANILVGLGLDDGIPRMTPRMTPRPAGIRDSTMPRSPYLHPVDAVDAISPITALPSPVVQAGTKFSTVISPLTGIHGLGLTLSNTFSNTPTGTPRIIVGSPLSAAYNFATPRTSPLWGGGASTGASSSTHPNARRALPKKVPIGLGLGLPGGYTLWTPKARHVPSPPAGRVGGNGSDNEPKIIKAVLRLPLAQGAPSSSKAQLFPHLDIACHAFASPRQSHLP